MVYVPKKQTPKNQTKPNQTKPMIMHTKFNCSASICLVLIEKTPSTMNIPVGEHSDAREKYKADINNKKDLKHYKKVFNYVGVCGYLTVYQPSWVM